MISIGQRVASIRRGRLAIASLALLAASALAQIESESMRRTNVNRGHEELIERDRADGALAQTLADSAFIVQRVAPARLSEALGSLHSRRVLAERRIQRANIELDAVMDRAHTERLLARILGWCGYAGVGVVALLWSAHITLRRSTTPS